MKNLMTSFVAGDEADASGAARAINDEGQEYD